MLISHNWLKEYFSDELPAPKKLADVLSLHAFEVEGVEEKNGDTIIDIDVLPNRSHDALSHDGIAREVGVLLNIKVSFPENEVSINSTESTVDFVDLKVENSHQVPRATKRLFTDVVVGESPEWLKKRLEAFGQRSINNVVDITNLVMFETGQPIHAFDFDKIAHHGTHDTQHVTEKKTITIRGAKKGEKVSTLDGNEWELEEGMLVIADGERALDIAGVKGGAESGVDENTTRVLLSACNFNATTIRKTSRTLGLITDASKRFEQGITPTLIDRAHERAAYYLSELAGAKAAEDVVDIYDRKNARIAKSYKVGVSLEEINGKLGTELSEKEVEKIFDRLGFTYKKVVPREKVVTYGQTLVGKPYKWGASVLMDAPDFFDCSSFINHVFVEGGITLPRMTFDQYVYGEVVLEKDLQPGDVIFSLNIEGDDVKDAIFVERLGHETKTGAHQSKTKDFMPGQTLEERVDHNGIYLGDGKIIHAARRNENGVTIEKLSDSSAFKNIVGYRRMCVAMEDPRFLITAPNERLDLRAGNGFLVSGNSEDLIEEIGRVYGYYNIEAQELPEAKQNPVVNKEVYYANKIRDILVSEGFSEIMTYSLVNEGDVELANPFASDKSHMRTTLRENVRKSLDQNTKNSALFGADHIRLFETGTVFTQEGEYTALTLGVAGKKAAQNDAVLEGVLAVLSEKLGATLSEKPKDGIVEINLTALVEGCADHDQYDFEDIDSSGVIYRTPSVYPFILRDIALWVPEKLSASDVEGVIRKNGGELLQRIDLFDEYTKDGRVSYAFHLVFQSSEKTLTDDEVNGIMDMIQKKAQDNSWEIR